MKANIQMSFKDEHKTFYVAKDIANFLNRGSAIRDKIITVLNQIREEIGIRSLKHFSQETAQNFVNYLQEQVKDGDLTRKTAETYLSAFNDIIKYVNEKLDKDIKTVSPTEVGLNRGARETVNRAVNQETHQAFLNFLEQKDNIQAQALIPSVGLQREFGLRLRESMAIKRESIEKALATNKLTIGRQDGTKNAKERSIPILKESQVQVLKSALNFMQQNNLKSLIPTQKLLEQYKYANKVKQEFNRLNDIKMDFHGERYFYAQTRFNEGASLKDISKELGHEREGITKIYLNIKWYRKFNKKTYLLQFFKKKYIRQSTASLKIF